MYHPTRGGARGGAAEFSWEKIKESKDREFYLGNSVAAPTGRWQDGRDINWYNKDSSTSTAADERREELRRIKEAETVALYAKLGRPPPTTGGDAEVRVGERLASGSSGAVRREVTGANSAPLDGKRGRWGRGEEGDEVSEADKKLARKFARDEVRRRRAEAGETEDEGGRDEKRSRRHDGHHRHSSSRRHDDDDKDRDGHHRHRHRHDHDSKRHRDDDRGDSESRRHRHRDDDKGDSEPRRHRDRNEKRDSRSISPRRRSRSRSPESSSRHRHRHRDGERRRSKASPPRHEDRPREEGSRHHRSSCCDHDSPHRRHQRD